MSATHDFRILLRGCTEPAGLDAVVRALGFEPRRTRVPARRLEAMLGPASGVRLSRVGRRNGAHAWLIECDEAPTASTVARTARRLAASALAEQHLLFARRAASHDRIMLAWLDAAGDLHHLTFEPADVRPTDAEAIAELAVAPADGATAIASKWARSLHRGRVTRRFFDDFRRRRDEVAAAWTNVPADAVAERNQLALLFLCRLMFLYFLQRRGVLAGDRRYLARRFHGWSRSPGTGSFYRAVIEPLFFAALNTRPERRSAAATALGHLPYLNGGLFERHALERRHPRLDLPDAVVVRVFDGLLERYRFTTRDSADAVAEGGADAAVDPEMLGRVFEGVMGAARREATGTFYTPARVADRLVREALAPTIGAALGLDRDAAARLLRQPTGRIEPHHRERLSEVLRSIRVLDPACGSGAFLLAGLTRIAALRGSVEAGPADEIRREVVGRSLHGVDTEPDAALICALRLWLALANTDNAGPEAVRPLPNLDRRVRQGDALLDPLDLAATNGDRDQHGAAADSAVRRAARALEPAARRYLDAEPAERPGLRRALARRERHLAVAWVRALERRLAWRRREIACRAGECDLWGETTAHARQAAAALPAIDRRQAELTELRMALARSAAVPFFSFPVHFADTAARGFDVIVSNPPWVRAHRWPAAVKRLVRERYAVCREPGWRPAGRHGAASTRGGQVDLALLFLERSIALLATGGTLALLLPAKSFRSLYAGPARRKLLLDLILHSIEDHSLDHRSMFRADAFVGVVVAQKPHDDAHGGLVRVTMHRRGAAPLRFEVASNELPLSHADPAAPWLLAPGDVRATLRQMQQAGRPLADVPGLMVRRGVVTGANEVLVLREAKARLGGLASVRAEGWWRSRAAEPRSRYEAVVEADRLRPIVRGAGVDAWRYDTGGYVVWVHGDGGAAQPAPRRLDAYLERHARRLSKRSGLARNAERGALFRVSPPLLRPKLVWQDLADTLRAVALPATVRSAAGVTPIVPLNTVYYLALDTIDRAMLLAAYFNSLPVRAFARALAERAKDARFRFFAWTVGELPLPARLWDGPVAERLLSVSAAAHEAGGLTTAEQVELDEIVAAAYGLDRRAIATLRSWDHWLRGSE